MELRQMGPWHEDIMYEPEPGERYEWGKFK